MEAIGLLGFVGIGVLLYFLPQNMYNGITNVFSLNDLGIRKNNWRHDYDDLLASLFLLLSFIFSFVFYEIPYFYVVYSILYLFSFLCVLAQTNRICKSESKKHRLSLIFAIYCMSGIAYLCAIGVFNHQQAYVDAYVFQKALANKEVFRLFYWATNHEPISNLLQSILFFASFYVEWAQFKYMRLEDSYKANNLIFFWIKVILICVILLFLSSQGFQFINNVFYVNNTMV